MIGALRVRGVTTAVVVLAMFVGSSACGSSAGSPAPAPPAAGGSALDPVVALAVQRLGTADAVAGSKWRSGGAISDPAREQVVLDAARTGAASRGLDPEATVAFFRDQIEGAKVVEYGLFSDWSADPSHAPATAPDLTGIRPELDRIGTGLLDALAAARQARTEPGCTDAVHRAAEDAGARTPLDALHRRGLDRALASACRM